MESGRDTYLLGVEWRVRDRHPHATIGGSLVVDDQAARRASLVDAFTSDYNTRGVPNAAHALRLLAMPRTHVDVVVVGYVGQDGPPHVAGVRLVRVMFKRWPWIPVIVVDGKQPRERLLAEVLLTGARDFLRRPLARGELAAMSRSRFSRTFHAVAGMPLRDYERDLRPKHAVELLIDSTASLTTIALDVGFYDLPHFDRAFRLRIGVAPREYRRRHARARIGRVP